MPGFEEQLERARQLAETILLRATGNLADENRIPLEHSFLLRSGVLLGVRFKQGEYSVEWLIGEPEIRLFRGQELLHTEHLHPPTLRAA